VLEYNFALFFGISLQLYQATLVSDDTPFDRYMEGNITAMTPEQVTGMELFSGIGRCLECHGGAELTNASVTSAGSKRLFRRAPNLIDTGFNNIGLRETREDIGIGRTDPWGRPLSLARQAKQGTYTDPNLNPPFNPALDGRLGVDGAFKTPGLRNVELTAPYFHNGSQLTLRQVMDFYNRGGDFGPIESRDGEIAPLELLGLADSDKEAIVAFLRALTDERVRFQRAPFDHPEIFLSNGALGTTTLVINDTTGRALDLPLRVPPVGRNGRSTPIKGFLEQ
jgi:cytochrome c peroxidase